MNCKAANLPVSGMTQKRAALLMNVSVRSVRDAGKLLRSGRHDLVALVEAGALSVHRALLLGGLKKQTEKQTLRRAWAAASGAERIEFVLWLIAEDE